MVSSNKSDSILRKAVLFMVAVAVGFSCMPDKASAERKRLVPNASIIKQIPKTWVVTGTFAEVDPKTLTAVTINEPQLMKFKWGTEWQGAEEGVWQLVRLGPRTKQKTILATGIVAPSAGPFGIDLQKFLPPSPPGVAATYHVQVVARAKASITNSSATMAGQAGKKSPAKELGFWSAPVVITYVKSTTPITKFEFPEVYRKATLVLDKFVVVEDQSGSGKEEFHIGGFVQELFQSSAQAGKFDQPGRQVGLGPYYYEMNDPMQRSFKFTQSGFAQVHSWSFNLSNKKQEWPRRFYVGFSVLEEDDGSGLGKWNKSLKMVKIALKDGKILKLTQKQIEDLLQSKLADGIKVSGWLVAAAELIGDAVGPIASAAGPVAIGATAVALVAIAVGAIFVDMADDDYGSNGALLTLPSNRIESIRNLPGKVVGKGEHERYVTSQQKLSFAGPALAGAAVACCDGKVEIRYHWEFSQREAE